MTGTAFPPRFRRTCPVTHRSVPARAACGRCHLRRPGHRGGAEIEAARVLAGGRIQAHHIRLNALHAHGQANVAHEGQLARHGRAVAVDAAGQDPVEHFGLGLHPHLRRPGRRTQPGDNHPIQEGHGEVKPQIGHGVLRGQIPARCEFQERRVAARSIQKPFQHPLHLRPEAVDTAFTFAQISRHIVLAPRRSNRCT